MAVNENSFSFGLAYCGVYLAMNGFDQGEALLDGNIAEIDESERGTIVSGILSLLEMIEEDVDGDGVVDENDAETIYQAALSAYDSDSGQTVGSGDEEVSLRINKVVAFNVALNQKGVDNSVKEWILDFYKGIADATHSGARLEEIENNVINILRNCLYGS